jgi:AAHS family 4-hydroxybenzoate transporter-like MFS transporter
MAGALFGLFLMRFTDRHGPFSVAAFPLLSIPLLLIAGLAPLPPDVFLPLSVVAASCVIGSHYGILSIAGIYYPSAIRANGGGWATSVAKIGGIIGPVIGAHVLVSGLPIVRSFAVLAVCPAVLAACAIGIGLIVRQRTAGAAAPAAEAVSAS